MREMYQAPNPQLLSFILFHIAFLSVSLIYSFLFDLHVSSSFSPIICTNRLLDQPVCFFIIVLLVLLSDRGLVPMEFL